MIVEYQQFIDHVADNGAFGTKAEAEQATLAVLDILGQRLTAGESTDLAAQLPTELKAPLDRYNDEAEAFDVDDFLRRLADQLGRGIGPEEARPQASAVLNTLAEAVSPGELDNLRSQLPAGFGALIG